MKKVISVLRGYRKKADLTQFELAKKVGVVSYTIARWENKSVIPNAKQCAKLCDILNIENARELLDDYINKEEK